MQMFTEERDKDDEDGFGPAPRRSDAFTGELFGEDGTLPFGNNYDKDGSKKESLFGFEYEKKQDEEKKELELSSESDGGGDFDSRFAFNAGEIRSSERGMKIDKDENDDEVKEEIGDTVDDDFFAQNQASYGMERRRVVT